MAALKQILKDHKASLEINLNELFGDTVPNSSKFRQAIGQDIIDIIRKRTDSNKFLKTSGKWYEYSDEYADSIEFKAYGKSKGDVNLKQTGEMMGLMDIIQENKQGITIGWNDDNAKKAHGHISGDIGKKRDFLGLTRSEITDLKDKWKTIAKEGVGSGLVSSVANTRDFVKGDQNIGRFKSLRSILEGLFGDG